MISTSHIIELALLIVGLPYLAIWTGRLDQRITVLEDADNFGKKLETISKGFTEPSFKSKIKSEEQRMKNSVSNSDLGIPNMKGICKICGMDTETGLYVKEPSFTQKKAAEEKRMNKVAKKGMNPRVIDELRTATDEYRPKVKKNKRIKRI